MLNVQVALLDIHWDINIPSQKNAAPNILIACLPEIIRNKILAILSGIENQERNTDSLLLWCLLTLTHHDTRLERQGSFVYLKEKLAFDEYMLNHGG